MKNRSQARTMGAARVSRVQHGIGGQLPLAFGASSDRSAVRGLYTSVDDFMARGMSRAFMVDADWGQEARDETLAIIEARRLIMGA